MPTKVYFNSACPVCKAGIEYQKGKVDDSNETEWIDVHTQSDAAGEVGADLEFIRERLHVVDDAGQLHVGADAFIAIWARSPRQRWIARIVSTRLVRPVFRRVYNMFAAALYRWNQRRKHW
ncbi:MAG: DUF393 domain-containing protein [Gammaproteobacteria bacterium]|nr:DUF393 domain-containing protein [Gammaproteobacteria bacterium]